VNLEKEFEQCSIAELRRVEDDLYPFGVAAVVAVGGIRHVAARVSDARGDHAIHLADQVLHAPEAAACKDGPFGCAHFTSST
jgi:hypothetical protein